MALKMDRLIDVTEVGYYLNEVAERGVVVSISTAGSGIALDSYKNVATVLATASGAKPLGILLNDFVNNDQTRVPTNWYKDQSQIGNKATILTKGWIVTNKVQGTPAAGDDAVLGASGYVIPLTFGSAVNQATNPKIGKFREKLDEAGYARIYVDL